MSKLHDVEWIYLVCFDGWKKQLSVHAKLNDGVQSRRIEVYNFRCGSDKY